MTVLRHFGLKEQPFGVTPDPRFLYASSTHREALASLLYGLESGLGFVTLIAQPGMGKTTLLFEALRRVGHSTRSVFLFHAINSPDDLIQSLLLDLGVDNTDENPVRMQAVLNQVLMQHRATGKRLVVVIDEAQNLDTQVLESVRMLSNFEAAGEKLLQIVLAGQPQLAEKLVSAELLQLRQRISIFARLDPLSDHDVSSYIKYRLSVAGYQNADPVFTEQAVALITQASEGIPRNINNICFNSLSISYAMQQRTVGVDVIQEVIRDLDVKLVYGIGESLQNEDDLTTQSHIQERGRLKLPALKILALVGLASIVFAIYSGIRLGVLRSSHIERPVESKGTSGIAVVGSQGAELTSSQTASPTSAPLIIAPSAPAPSTTAPVTSPSASTAPKLLSVRAKRGATIYGICVERFGKCSPSMLKYMLQLNPMITDPSRIKLGQQIAVPLLRQVQ